MPDTNGQNGEARIDRIERAIETLTNDVHALTGDVQALTGSHRTIVGDLAALAESHFRLIDVDKDEYKELLRAQVLLKDTVDAQLERAKLSDQRMDRFEKGMDEMREALHALISVVDDMIRRKPPQN
jgi:hypothetical protein